MHFDCDIILFTTGPMAYAPKRLSEEANKLNVDLRVIHYKDINIVYSNDGMELNLKGEKMPIPKGIFLRGLGEDSMYNPLRTAILLWYKSKGTKILNEMSYDKWPSLDKTTQYINLSSVGLPVAESFSFASIEELVKWGKSNYPFIAKDVIGSCGTGVFKISNDNELDELLKKFNSNFKVKALLFQRFLPNAVDLRVVMLGGKIVGAMKRTAKPGNFLSNFSQGGLVEEYRIGEDSEASSIATNTVKLFKLDYCGVDLMRNIEGKWIVLEVNRSCQFEGFEKATTINVAQKVINYLLQ
ncbi:MAG: RimK family alpha-L-glutamate ligase [Candidatus Woesebacteria bacterium]|nr:MAG: RimK family alpha-L-glutamate ligase [Candidatus Woesebacteria bacterium]